MSKQKTQSVSIHNATKERTGAQLNKNQTAPAYETGLEGVWILDKVDEICEDKIDEIRIHPTVTLVRQLVVAPVLAAHWSVEEKNGKAPEGAREFIEETIMPFRHELLRTSLMGCIDYGWQGYEKVYGLNDDNQLVIRKIKPLIQQDTWCLVEENGSYWGLQNLQDRLTSPTIEDRTNLPKSETLLTNFDVVGTNWYGTSVFKSTECPYDEYMEVKKATNRYDTKVAGTHWVVHYPPGSSDYEGTSLSNDVIAQNILAALESSGSIAVPRSLEGFIDSTNEKSPNAWQIELLSDTSQTTSNFLQRLKYIDSLLVRTFGIPERAVLEGQHGTKAEAGTHTDAAVINMDMRHRTLVNEYNEQIINSLLRFNWGEEYENTVFITPAPILDTTITMMKELYSAILKDPQGFLDEYDNLDTEAIKSVLGVPFFRKDESERHTHEFGLHG